MASEMIERVAEAMRLRAIERGQPIHPTMAQHLAVAAIEALTTDDLLKELDRRLGSREVEEK